jgi:Domain of unknown function (DUF4129)
MRVKIWRSVTKAIAALAAAGFLWFATTAFPSIAAAPDSGPAGVDPARAARDVFQDESFWWKRLEPRLEPRTVSLSWFESIVAAVWSSIRPGLQRIVEWILAFLRKLFSVFGRPYTGGADAIWLIVIGLLAWAAWKLAPAIVRWLSGRRPARITHEDPTWQPLAEAADLFAQAGQAFRDGLHAEAIRLALLALIARLEKQGLLRYDTTRTNREYLRELRQRADLAACFGQLSRIYDRVWYGRASAGAAEAEQAISLCGSVINREDLVPE